MSRTSDIVVALATSQSPASGNPYQTQKSNLFQDFAAFDGEVDNTGLTPTVNFDTGNKQLVSNAGVTSITLSSTNVVTGLVRIPSSASLGAIEPAGNITWLGPVPAWEAGKLIGIACHFDGTNWTLNGSKEE